VAEQQARPEPGADVGILVTIRSLMPNLAPVERRVAQAVLDDPQGVAWRSISELARACGTSATSVVRFCRAIGLRGYPDLRLELAGAVARDDALREARSHGATSAAVTNFPWSPITEVADFVLITAARETAFRSGATTSRIAQLTVVDCLFVTLAQQDLPGTRVALERTFAAAQAKRARRTRRQQPGDQ
jgi:DNA-binding MurR/RpiR family transcriptional regulator